MVTWFPGTVLLTLPLASCGPIFRVILELELKPLDQTIFLAFLARHLLPRLVFPIG